MRVRSIVVPVILAALLGVTPETPATAAQDPLLAERIRLEDEQREPRWTGFYRVRAGYPQSLSGGLGVIRTRLPKGWDCMTSCPFRGWVLQAEPGLHGAQFGVGYAMMMAEKRHNEHFATDLHLAFGVKAVLLRTWDGANLSPSHRSFAGIEYSFTVTGFNFSLGTLRRIDDVGGGDWLVSGGFGWGF